ncbi:hypothetical protein MKEN_01102700 [Mycena kentingensis (nom. inval.)]|nr:hypothetical protein MKEN_01102700 [Mycena kentingensis (nom. inval.)]
MDSIQPEPTDLACPDPLEKIFQRVEEQNEARARQAEAEDRVAEALARVDSTENLKRSRRRGSISMTIFGQLDASSDGASAPTTPALSDIAAKSPFFQAQLKSQNNSQESFASGGSTAEHHEDENAVTHMHTIAPRQSISRAAGRLIPRRLSRAASTVIPSANRPRTAEAVVISVAAATVELPENSEPAATVVHAPLRNQPSKASMTSSLGLDKGSWMTKFTKKFRRKSKAPLVNAPASA